MAMGRLLVWLKPNSGEAKDVFLPASIAEEIREKLVLSGQMSTLIAITTSLPRPKDEYSQRVFEQMRAVREAFEDDSSQSYKPALVGALLQDQIPGLVRPKKPSHTFWSGILELLITKKRPRI